MSYVGDSTLTVPPFLPFSLELASGSIGAAGSFGADAAGSVFHLDMLCGAGLAFHIVVNAAVNIAANAAKLFAVSVIILHANTPSVSFRLCV